MKRRTVIVDVDDMVLRGTRRAKPKPKMVAAWAFVVFDDDGECGEVHLYYSHAVRARRDAMSGLTTFGNPRVGRVVRIELPAPVERGKR